MTPAGKPRAYSEMNLSLYDAASSATAWKSRFDNLEDGLRRLKVFSVSVQID